MLLENMKNDTLLCACAVVIYLGDAKMSKKTTRFVDFKFLRIATDEHDFRRINEEWQICKLTNVLKGKFAP